MRFYTLLKSGVSIEQVASDFVEVLLSKSWAKSELCLNITCNFVNDLLSAIGIKCQITPEQIDEGGSYVWPMEQIQIYNFHYVPMDFQKLEIYLMRVCSVILLKQEDFIKDGLEEFESPVELLMQVTAVWCNVYKKLQRLEELQTNKRFEEPLARINFNFLLGMHVLRKLYGRELYLLDPICSRLFCSAIQGLYYKQTHEMIFSGLLKIFRKDFYFFYNNTTPNFFYEAFSVEFNNLTPLILYQNLKEMLMEIEIENTHKLNSLTNILIEPNMLEVYFSTLMAKKFKTFCKISSKNVMKIQEEALKFLHVLQSKLLTIDCFSREFFEAILYLVFSLDKCTSVLASNLYLAMMKRIFSDQMILKHIMDFYVNHVATLVHLDTFLMNIYDSFKYLFSFDNVLQFITDIHCTDVIKFFSAHMLVALFEVKLQESVYIKSSDSSGQQELEHFLQILPEIFENLQCQICEGILLTVYSYIPFENLQKSTLDNFIHYVVGVFMHIDNNLQYPLLMNIFEIFHKCMLCTKEWQHLELFAEHLFSKYREMIRDFKRREQAQEEIIDQSSLLHYNNLIKRLNIILKTEYDLLDNYMEVIDNLLHYFIYNDAIKALIVKENCLIDVYALEMINSLLFRILKSDNIDKRSLPLSELVDRLLKYLWSQFRDLEAIFHLSIIKIKTYFCCILNLYFNLPLKIHQRDYYQLVQILIMVNFQSKSFNRQLQSEETQHSHPLLVLEYKRLMLRQFIEMHKCQHLEIKSNIVWKLCIYYKMYRHPFNEELKNLIVTLGNHRLSTYKNIIAILVYNLYRQKPALSNYTIKNILNQHRHLINNCIQVESPVLLNGHVVLKVLEIVDKALSVQRVKKGHNRLMALKHLNIFLTDLDLSQLGMEEHIDELKRVCESRLINTEERTTLKNFSILLTGRKGTSNTISK